MALLVTSRRDAAWWYVPYIAPPAQYQAKVLRTAADQRIVG